jgi:hypothetical protein
VEVLCREAACVIEPVAAAAEAAAWVDEAEDVAWVEEEVVASRELEKVEDIWVVELIDETRWEEEVVVEYQVDVEVEVACWAAIDACIVAMSKAWVEEVDVVCVENKSVVLLLQDKTEERDRDGEREREQRKSLPAGNWKR